MVVQTGRFLLKIAVAVAMQQPNMELPASAAYLKSKAAKTVMVGEQGWIKAVFSALAQHSVRRAVSDIMKHPDSGAHLPCLLPRLYKEHCKDSLWCYGSTPFALAAVRCIALIHKELCRRESCV